ncbi:unnamed protein product [Angiostrongylus costaricensis]|uniref:IstB_IS21 domain-containing protein n=1 Tax=Angiostrongylus costaricensis TaxID=334426 RepID=A0A0R3PVQ9_ANGCS|nr:unnamed protein product [Angiostrongylus costaricensis]
MMLGRRSRTQTLGKRCISFWTSGEIISRPSFASDNTEFWRHAILSALDDALLHSRFIVSRRGRIIAVSFIHSLLSVATIGLIRCRLETHIMLRLLHLWPQIVVVVNSEHDGVTSCPDNLVLLISAELGKSMPTSR